MKKKIIYALIVFTISMVIFLYFSLNGVFRKGKHYHKPMELDYYHGIVVNEDIKPIDSVEVKIIGTEIIINTNEKGYFKFKPMKIKVSDSLLFYRNEYVQKVVRTYYGGKSNFDKNTIYYFSRKELDTVVMIKKE